MIKRGRTISLSFGQNQTRNPEPAHHINKDTMTSTLNLILPVKTIPWAMTKGDVTTSSGRFTIGFDNGYIINNGKRYKIGCDKGYEYIRKAHGGRRKYINARVMLALYLPDTEAE